jgi:hypothetical protein
MLAVFVEPSPPLYPGKDTQVGISGGSLNAGAAASGSRCGVVAPDFWRSVSGSRPQDGLTPHESGMSNVGSAGGSCWVVVLVVGVGECSDGAWRGFADGGGCSVIQPLRAEWRGWTVG